MSIIRKTAFPLQRGTAQGQCLFWDDSLKKWVYTETSELIWDDTNKYLGINTNTPIAYLDVRGAGSPTPTFAASAFNPAVVMMDNGTMTATSYPSILHFDTNAYAGVGLGTVYTGNANTLEAVFEKVLVDNEAVSLNPGGASPTVVRFTTNIETTDYAGISSDAVIISGSTSDDGCYAVSAVSTTDVTITNLAGGAVTLTSEAAVATYISARVMVGGAPGLGVTQSLEIIGGHANAGDVVAITGYGNADLLQFNHNGAAGSYDIRSAAWAVTNQGLGYLAELALVARATPLGSINGHIYFDSDDNKFYFYQGGWKELGDPALWTRTGTILYPKTSGDDVEITGTQLTVGNNTTATSTLKLTNNSYAFEIISNDTGIADFGFAGSSQLQLSASKLVPTTTNDLDLGDTTHYYKDLYVGSIKGAAGRKTVILKVQSETDALTTGDGKMYFTIPAELNGYDLITVGAHIYTASSSGLPSIAIYNFTDSQDMLSTNITIDATEVDSNTATTAPVINTSYDDVVTADVIRIDVDVAGTGAKGLEVRMGFQLP
uniref:Uncharacterized protein n=1 Tax=viral metagenome TaxID=1070528 RepID=A0A6M3L9R1_9ZZZZ